MNDYFFHFKGGNSLKEIGERLKEARESIGVSIEEAAEDLHLREEQIQNIEEGNLEAFKDIFYLKYFIRDYSKYLGLNYEDMVDEFNEFLFDYTSKISINDIKNAKKNAPVKKEEVHVSSPYTASTEKKPIVLNTVIYIVVIIALIILGFLILTSLKDEKEKEDKPLEVAYRV